MGFFVYHSAIGELEVLKFTYLHCQLLLTQFNNYVLNFALLQRHENVGQRILEFREANNQK